MGMLSWAVKLIYYAQIQNCFILVASKKQQPATVRAPPPDYKPVAHPRGIDIATFLASWDWLRMYLEDEPLVHHKGVGPLLPVSKRQLANEGPPLLLQQE